MFGQRRAPSVLLVIGSSIIGGAQTHILLLAKSFQERSIKVSVALPHGDLFDRLHHEGIKVWRLSNSPLSIIQILWIVLKTRPDILHTHLLNAALYGTLASLFSRGIRRVYTVQNIVIYPGMSAWKRHLFPWLHRIVAYYSHVVAAVSSDIASYFCNELGVDKKKVRVIYNCVDYDSACRHAAAPLPEIPDSFKGKLIIGSVGRFVNQKGHLDLLEAFSLISSEIPDLRLILIGDGPLLPEYQKFARKAGIEDLVFMPGASTNVYAWIKLFNLVVFPSIFEGLPLIHLEAAALGKPIIATNVGGTGEIIEDGKSGLLVRPGQPQDLAWAIRKLCMNSDLMTDVGNAVYMQVRDKFSLASCIQNTLGAYGDGFSILACSGQPTKSLSNHC